MSGVKFVSAALCAIGLAAPAAAVSLEPCCCGAPIVGVPCVYTLLQCGDGCGECLEREFRFVYNRNTEYAPVSTCLIVPVEVLCGYRLPCIPSPHDCDICVPDALAEPNEFEWTEWVKTGDSCDNGFGCWSFPMGPF